ncbi:signal recognition particle-docking protein FtsY [Erwinia oleae]|uniref:signal recognition particle-docking protein FtsY n=1 Tax=Erwinia oleae TaxID=796334 RepID=UPI00055189E1|nr:signal recognition particle-docking protein FtsY [Erwinia oleae]
MAKNKKRGFFSWLGLGRDEKDAPEETTEKPEEQPAAVAETPEAAVEQQAEEWVELTETVAREQAEEAPSIATGPLSAPEEETLPVTTPAPKEEILPEELPVTASAPKEEILPEELPVTTPALKEEILPEELPVTTPAPKEEILPEEAPIVSAPEDAELIDKAHSLAAALDIVEQVEQERPTKEGFFARLKRSLVKTRQNLGSGFVGLFRGKKIDDDLFEELEEQLLIADVGVETTRRIITNLTTQANRKQLRDAEALYGLLKQEMSEILAKVDQPLDVGGKTPFVILMVGVNGVGKTTTIGKLARQYQAEGKSVMLAAGDTFRAAAVEQLQVWGQRNNIPVIAQHTGADSASVIFDAIQAAKARHVDVLIADTAGRLQNKAHLMEELKKITRVMKKLDEQAPHEVMLTIDASTGQNAISQTKLFHEAVGLTGITLTKLDGTAKGGVIFSVADQFSIPIRYIGVGEGIEDLRTFKAHDFIEALFAREDSFE